MCIMLLVLFLSAFYGNFGSSILVHVVDYITDLYSILAVDKKIVPKVANDVKLISAGKILENSKTIAQCRSPFGEPPADGITMHVVVQPSLTKAKTGELDDVTWCGTLLTFLCLLLVSLKLK